MIEAESVATKGTALEELIVKESTEIDGGSRGDGKVCYLERNCLYIGVKISLN